MPLNYPPIYQTISGNTAGVPALILTGTLTLAGGPNITLSQAGNAISVSGPAAGLPSADSTKFVQANAAFAGTSASGTIASNGISVSIGPYLTTAAASNHSHGNPTLALTNLSGTTASNSGGLTLSLSAANPGAGGGIAAAAGTQTAETGTVMFSNSNNVTFGMTNSSIVTASASFAQSVQTQNFVAVIGSGANGNGTFTSGTLSLKAGDGITLSTGANVLSFHAATNFLTTAALSNHSHGNPTLALTNLSGTTASASNGFTLSLSAANPGGGAGVNRGFMEIMDGDRFTTCAVLNNATYSNRVIFVPFVMKEGGSLSVNTVQVFLSRSSGTVLVATMGIGFYTQANATSLNLAFSTTHNFSVQSSVSFSGIRAYNFTGMGANVLTAGEWVMGFYGSAAASNSIPLHAMGGDGFVLAGYINTGTNQTAASHSQSHVAPFWGVWNATTAAFPSAVALSSISGGNPAANSPDLYAIVKE